VAGSSSVVCEPTESHKPHIALSVKLAHTLGIVVATVITGLLTAILADGMSVIRLKPASELPRLTDYSLKKHGLDYRADELLGAAYGVGLHHDASGARWTEIRAGYTLTKYVEELGLHQVIAAVPSVIMTDGLKHPAHFLSCHSIRNSGLGAMSLAIIAMFATIVMVGYHVAAVIHHNPFTKIGASPKVALFGKAFPCLIWFVLYAGFLIVTCVAIYVFYGTHECDNPFIPSIKLSDHFYWDWAYPIANVGVFASLAVFAAQLFFNSTDPYHFTPTTKSKMGAVLVLVLGIIIGIVCQVSCAAGVGAFKSPAPKDPNVNPCEGQKPKHAGPDDNYFSNVDCMKDGVIAVFEQAGADVTKGYIGGLDAGEWRVPITTPYDQTDLCPVNVHWHLGAEHRSAGEFDEDGHGPGDHRRAGEARLGHRCHKYDAEDPKFTTPYEWKHCKDMHVGETYEVHWPHSAAGDCGTQWQYQTPFYDGVFCNDGVINILTPLNTYKTIGVQAQIYTIVNDESYYRGNMIEGMQTDGDFGADMTMYTGSTTGTSRNQEVCSRYAPITWQVDRKCHLISASSFDKMCEMMKQMKDDMSDDLHPHGARETTATAITANNQVFDP
jgi:hypothetical protein